jgi:Holliday junction resolvase RusA-like endonuclease
MTQGALWRDDAQRYLASQTELKTLLQGSMAANGWEMYLRKVPLQLRVAFGWAVHTHDLSNLLKALEDAGNKIVWQDDRWIDRIDTWRVPAGNGLVEFWVRRTDRFDDDDAWPRW